MSDKRRGLGRGLGALIPSSAAASGNGSAPSRPVDLFFPEARKRTPAAEVAATDENTAVPEKEETAKPQSLASPQAPADPSDGAGFKDCFRDQEGTGPEDLRGQG